MWPCKRDSPCGLPQAAKVPFRAKVSLLATLVLIRQKQNDPALHAKDHSGQQSMPSAWLSFAVLGKVVPGKLRATQIMPNSIRYFLQTSCTPCKGSFWPAKHAFAWLSFAGFGRIVSSKLRYEKKHAKLYTVVSVDSAAWGFFPAGSGVLSTDVLSTDVLSTAGPWNMPPCSRQ